MALHRLVKAGWVTLAPSHSGRPLDGVCAVLITASAALQQLPHPSMPPSKVRATPCARCQHLERRSKRMPTC